MKPLYLSDEARADLNEQSSWYFKRQPGLEQRFLEAVGQTLSAIQKRPDAAAYYGDGGNRKRNLGKPFERFSVIYNNSDSSQIVVVAIWEGHRNPSDLSRR